MMRKFFVALVAGALLLGGCSGQQQAENPATLSARVADKVVVVADEHRALRVCLLAAGVVEVMTDRVQTFDGNKAPDALGRLMALQGAIDTAKLASPFWMNTDMSDVAFQFSKVLRDAGQEKIGRTLLGGVHIGNFINVAERATLTASKGAALLVDINAMLKGVSEGTLTEEAVWVACEDRIAQNRRVLGTISGARMQ